MAHLAKRWSGDADRRPVGSVGLGNGLGRQDPKRESTLARIAAGTAFIDVNRPGWVSERRRGLYAGAALSFHFGDQGGGRKDGATDPDDVAGGPADGRVQQAVSADEIALIQILPREFLQSCHSTPPGNAKCALPCIG